MILWLISFGIVIGLIKIISTTIYINDNYKYGWVIALIVIFILATLTHGLIINTY